MRTKLRCSNCVLTGTGYFTKKTLYRDLRLPPDTPQSRSTKGLVQEGGRADHHQHWKTSLKVSTLKSFQASQDPTQI